jgi:AcrR family transcriptional regulator
MKTTPARIARVALRVLEDEGPAAVSMRRIAKEVGITPMAIYHHFPSREALLDTVTDREFGELLGYIQARVGKGAVEARLTSLLEGYVDYAFSRPRVFDYVFSGPRPGARRYPGDFRARRSPTFNPLVDLVTEAMRKRQLRKDDAGEVALALWAHVHGYVMLYRAGRFALGEGAFRALLRRSLGRLVRGLKA